MSGGLGATELAGLELFAGVSPTELELLAAASERRSLAEGETLIRQGASATTLFWIEAGQLALRVEHHDRSTGVMSVGPGDLLGWSALQPGARWLTTARALSPVTLVAMPVEPVLDLLATGGEGSRTLIARFFGYAAAHLDGTRRQLLGLGREGVITAG